MVKNMGEISMLYDFYGDLLTERQRTVLEYYYGDDYTLGEIAEHAGISRQAVHDTVHKAEKALKSYESALGLVDRYRRSREEIAEVLDILADIEKNTGDADVRQKLRSAMKIVSRIE